MPPEHHPIPPIPSWSGTVLGNATPSSPYKEAKRTKTERSRTNNAFFSCILSFLCYSYAVGRNPSFDSTHTPNMKTKTVTPAVTPATPNAPIVSPADSLLNRAKSIVGQTPRLDGVVKKSRLSKDGETITTFNGFDWEKVPAKIRPRVMAAVRFVMAAEAEERAIAAHLKAEAAFSELV
jgi:hypothetical protein